jgi:phytoene dehydrogenase-like protein
MAHYMRGAAYTVGATQNLSIRSSSVVRGMGGDTLVGATIRRIIIEDGRAVGVTVSRTADLAESDNAPVYTIRAKNVVCATSIYNLYNKFLPQTCRLSRISRILASEPCAKAMVMSSSLQDSWLRRRGWPA